MPPTKTVMPMNIQLRGLVESVNDLQTNLAFHQMQGAAVQFAAVNSMICSTPRVWGRWLGNEILYQLGLLQYDLLPIHYSRVSDSSSSTQVKRKEVTPDRYGKLRGNISLQMHSASLSYSQGTKLSRQEGQNGGCSCQQNNHDTLSVDRKSH